MALRTFIPLACCLWKTATPLCTAGATAPAFRVVLKGVERTAWERHRVWTAGRVVGRAERERARMDEARDFVADAADRIVWSRLAMVGWGVVRG
jgi:hypothetical protein